MHACRHGGDGRLAHAAIAQAGEPRAHAPRGNLAALTIGALGVVYGAIGTSPLYVIDQIFLGPLASRRPPTMCAARCRWRYGRSR